MTTVLAWSQLRRRPAGFAGLAAALLLAVATPRRIRQLLYRHAALKLAPLGTAAARAFLAAFQHRTMASPHARIGATLPAPVAATALATTGGEAR
ncbi:hypothetical protein ACFYS8_17290 [Kitasatospora sp. NPDC004615]|uniref:hypothetical protein n=1 Tax=Kitasatospora sp. NPDC004615 TaxID=3364017 RepID=UPI00368ED8D8